MDKSSLDFLLLQLNDACFPIGSYAHSYGLETYIQKGLIRDAAGAAEYIGNMLLYNFSVNEFMEVRMAYDICESMAGEEEKVIRLNGLDELVTAARIPSEIRRAGERLASRFMKTVSHFSVDFIDNIYKGYAGSGKICNHAVAYAVFCHSAGIGMHEALKHYMYTQTSLMVTNCVKTIPLSQTDGQKILFELIPLFDRCEERTENLGEDDFGIEAPGFEIRSMQHEGLYSRLYMS